MENNNENKGFQYTYSAKEQAELKRIREKYTPPTEAEDKMERLICAGLRPCCHRMRILEEHILPFIVSMQ